MAYFDRLGDDRFLATAQVGGAWDVERQQIAPALGLLVHAVEQHRDGRRRDHLRVARLSFDILGTIPLAEVHVGVRVLRGGRTIELVEATLAHELRGSRPTAWCSPPWT